jgi:hypothetical protein
MNNDNLDPEDSVCSPQALISALEYLYVEAMDSGFYFPAHLILVAALAVEELGEANPADGINGEEPKSERRGAQILRLIHDAVPRNAPPSNSTEGH